MNWKEIATELWDIVDNIDTFGDAFHPEITPYFKAVNKETQKRFNFMTSDGFTLTPVDSPPEKPPQ